jgi:hypothetical protein
MSTDISDWIVDETRQPDRGFPYPIVKIIHRIRENATGIIRETESTLGFGVEGYEGRPFDYCWTEGNFSCDCNRYLFFRRAAGEDDGEDFPCSDDRFAVQLVNPKDGKVFYDEFDDAALAAKTQEGQEPC